MDRLQQLAISSGVHFWNLEENALTERASEFSRRRAEQVSMSPDGNDYAVADIDDSAVRVYDVRSVPTSRAIVFIKLTALLKDLH